jgi:hypothetical protein
MMRKWMKYGPGALVVATICMVPTTTLAQGLADYDYENLSFRGIGADWGYIWPNKADATTLYSLRADLGFLGPAIRVIPAIHYWNSSLKRSEVDRLATRLTDLPALQDGGVVITGEDLGDIEWSAISFTMDAQAVWTGPYRIFGFIGLGLGLHAMNGKGASIDGTFVEDLLDTVTPGVAVMGGLEYEVSPRVRLYGEGRYTVQSEVRYPGIRLGGAIMFSSSAGGTQ